MRASMTAQGHFGSAARSEASLPPSSHIPSNASDLRLSIPDLKNGVDGGEIDVEHPSEPHLMVVAAYLVTGVVTDRKAVSKVEHGALILGKHRVLHVGAHGL